MLTHTMPLTEIAKIAIDRTEPERDELTQNIMNIFNCDSATNRCEPEEYPALAKAQSKVFDPMISWANHQFGVNIVATNDFWMSDQTEETNEKIENHIRGLSPYHFICLDNITALGKSTIVGLNFLHNNINIEQTVRSSLMEEYYQTKVSGHQIGDTYGTWLLDASARQRVSSHRLAMNLLQYTTHPSTQYKV
jgi:chaperone required for assembly of F1-ATPase